MFHPTFLACFRQCFIGHSPRVSSHIPHVFPPMFHLTFLACFRQCFIGHSPRVSSHIPRVFPPTFHPTCMHVSSHIPRVFPPMFHPTCMHVSSHIPRVFPPMFHPTFPACFIPRSPHVSCSVRGRPVEHPAAASVTHVDGASRPIETHAAARAAARQDVRRYPPATVGERHSVSLDVRGYLYYNCCRS